MKRRLVVATVLLTLAAAAPAAACSADAGMNLGPQLRASDGAFVGKLYKRRGARMWFRVQVRVKGKLGRRVVVRALPDCAPTVRRGRRVGLLLDRWRAQWWANALSVVPPGELLKAAGIGP